MSHNSIHRIFEKDPGFVARAPGVGQLSGHRSCISNDATGSKVPGKDRPGNKIPSKWSYSCCATLAGKPFNNIPSMYSPSSFHPLIRTQFGRSTQPRIPGTERQPSQNHDVPISSRGVMVGLIHTWKGNVGASGYLALADSSSSSIPMQNIRVLHPTWHAAIPIPPYFFWHWRKISIELPFLSPTLLLASKSKGGHGDINSLSPITTNGGNWGRNPSWLALSVVFVDFKRSVLDAIWRFIESEYAVIALFGIELDTNNICVKSRQPTNIFEHNTISRALDSRTVTDPTTAAAGGLEIAYANFFPFADMYEFYHCLSYSRCFTRKSTLSAAGRTRQITIITFTSNKPDTRRIPSTWWMCTWYVLGSLVYASQGRCCHHHCRQQQKEKSVASVCVQQLRRYSCLVKLSRDWTVIHPSTSSQAAGIQFCQDLRSLVGILSSLLQRNCLSKGVAHEFWQIGIPVEFLVVSSCGLRTALGNTVFPAPCPFPQKIFVWHRPFASFAKWFQGIC